MDMDLNNVTNDEVKRFLHQFFQDRQINKDFYEKVPEVKFDFRIVNTPSRKSDSPRESLAHQIDTTRDYINGIKTGILRFGVSYENLTKPIKLSKVELLRMLQKEDEELVSVLSDKEIVNKTVTVPWSKTPIKALIMIWSLDSHEILHTGWNLAIMDCLDIERFESLKNMWG